MMIVARIVGLSLFAAGLGAGIGVVFGLPQKKWALVSGWL